MEAPHWMSILLLCAAVFRITRFVTKDAFPLVARPRDWIQRNWDPFDDWDNWRIRSREDQDLLLTALRERGLYTSKGRPTEFKRSVAYLVGCTWCVSIWVSAGVVAFAVLTPLHLFSWWWALYVWAAASTVAGLVSRLDED